MTPPARRTIEIVFLDPIPLTLLAAKGYHYQFVFARNRGATLTAP